MLMISSTRELGKLTECIAAMREVLAWSEHRLYGVDEEISLWSPAQQVHHAAMALRAVLETIEKLYAGDDPGIVTTGSPNGSGMAVLTFGSIPRGRAKTPGELNSPPEVTRQDVEKVLAEVDKALALTADRAKYLYELKGRWPHPGLGSLSALQWLRFVRIHTEHHLALAHDIGKSLQDRMPRPQ